MNVVVFAFANVECQCSERNTRVLKRNTGLTVYAMIMALLQTFIMEEKYERQTFQKYKFLVKRIKSAFDILPNKEKDGDDSATEK